MVSMRTSLASLGSPLRLLQVLPLGVYDFDVFAIVSGAAPGTCQNAPLVTRQTVLPTSQSPGSRV
jgi:hypothetical protein